MPGSVLHSKEGCALDASFIALNSPCSSELGWAGRQECQAGSHPCDYPCCGNEAPQHCQCVPSAGAAKRTEGLALREVGFQDGCAADGTGSQVGMYYRVHHGG